MADAARWSCTEAEYFASPRLSRSGLEVFMKTPALYAEQQLGARPDPTAAMRWGRLVHLRILEPHEFRRRVIVKAPDLNRRSNAGKAEFARIEAEGLLLVSMEEGQQLERIANAVMAHPLAGRMVERSDREVSFTWTDEPTGIECRARLDMVRFGRVPAIVDLKTSDDPSPREFGRSAAKYGYHRQAAFYSRPIREMTERDPAVFIIAVRSDPPHEVAVYEVEADDIAAADAQIDEAMVRLAACQASGRWQSPWELPTAQPLELPRWALETP